MPATASVSMVTTYSTMLAEVVEHLVAASPAERATIELSTYRGLKPPWTDWHHLADRGRAWAIVLAEVAMGAKP